jgi:hypothetical protein
MAGPHTPDVFDASTWRDRALPPLDIELAAHHISAGNGSVSLSGGDEPRCFHLGTDGFAVVEHMPAPHGERLLSHLADRLQASHSVAGAGSIQELGTVLARGLEFTDAGVQSSALVVQFAPDTNILRVAWAGACGLIVLRDRELLFQSFVRQSPWEGLERAFYRNDTESSARKHDRLGERKSSTRSTSHGTSEADRHWESTYLDSCVQAAFVELEDGDLVLGGSQSFFANLSETQIVSFVRPVPDPNDKTLAIANSTSLGSFRTDDVTFISYYLSHLAYNFATSETARPLLVYPFPPSPVFEDVTVIAAACSFST